MTQKKKYFVLLILLMTVVVIGGFLFVNKTNLMMLADGYTKSCGVLPDGVVCTYCKCEAGEGYQGIPSFQCDDGSKPVCKSGEPEESQGV